jgi:hypothetical protein
MEIVFLHFSPAFGYFFHFGAILFADTFSLCYFFKENDLILQPYKRQVKLRFKVKFHLCWYLFTKTIFYMKLKFNFTIF